MEYTINKLANLSKVSTRTLRYYDQIGLLKPSRVSSNGYRIYGQREVDLLQQILFYRELGFALESIKQIIQSPTYDKEKALYQQLTALETRKQEIEGLIQTLTKTIDAIQGGNTMNDREKFEGFKQKLIDDNEAQYGDEIRSTYNQSMVEASNATVKGMSQEQWLKADALSNELHICLKNAFEHGDPTSEEAQKACDLHRQWLCMFWDETMYSKEAHKGLAEMYVGDERFKKHYEEIATGCCEFFKDAINYYCK